MQTESIPGAAATHPRRWQLLWLLAVAQFMLILDVTVVAIALPHMEVDLNLSREQLTWVVTGYTMMFGGLLLLGGRIADLVGNRTVVLTGLAIFVLASAITGTATGPAWVIVGRLAQGLGAALLSPAALSMLPKLFTGPDLNKALGIWSAVGGTGSAVGVLLGGIMTAGPGWPWAFYINIPVGLVILIALGRHLPKLPRGSTGGLDAPGALLVTAGTGAAVFGLVSAGEAGWLSARLWIPLVVAAVLYGLFALRLRTAANPLVRPGLLTARPVAAGSFVIWAATALMISVFFLGSFDLQQHKGFGPLATGVLFLPVAVGAMIGAQAAGRLIATLGAKRLAAASFAVSAVGIAAPSVAVGTVALIIGLSIASIGLGALFVVASAAALGNVAPEEAGVASGTLSTFHEFGATFGVPVVSSLAAASITGSTAEGFTRTFAIMAGAAITALIIAAVVLPRAESDT